MRKRLTANVAVVGKHLRVCEHQHETNKHKDADDKKIG